MPAAPVIAPLVPRAETLRPAEPAEGTPQVEVAQAEHDFGVMDLHAERSHDFVFRNLGDATLRLTAGDTSCSCTVSELDVNEVSPGGSTEVTVTWSANESLGPYRQTATIFTNDPARPRVELTVTGRVTSAARTVPGSAVTWTPNPWTANPLVMDFRLLMPMSITVITPTALPWWTAPRCPDRSPRRLPPGRRRRT